MKLELKQHFQIESARFLPHLPETHPCRRMHGHSFKISLTLIGETDPKIGWVIDYGEIEKLIKPLLMELDHRVLNEVSGLENPTSENICIWIFEKAKQYLPLLTRVTIAETTNTECSYPA
jgi:6-pyruvoyltetrahydropterin/6-carboxytetrahydropterin synthase